MKVSILMNNTAQPSFISEHGLSFFIESQEKKILLDAGSSGQFIQNAKRLSISLSEVDFALLSHGHFDHSDGFRNFFKENSTAPLYLREEAVDAYFSFSSGSPKFVGIHKNLDTSRFSLIKESFTQLSDHISLISHPKSEKERRKEETFYQRKRGWDDFVQDDFSHQQTLVIRENQHLYLFNSCCHGVLEEILNHSLSYFSEYQGFSLFGGLHFLYKEKPLFSPDYVKELGYTLKNMGIAQLYTGHCTCELAFSLLQESLGDNIHTFSAGEQYLF